MEDFFKRDPIASAPLSLIFTVPGTARWEEALAAWVTYLNGLDREYELLLVSEQPGVSVETEAGRYARARAMPAFSVAGFGAALKQGLAEARHPLVFYTRCDGHYKPSDLQQLLKGIDKLDYAAGYRVYPRGAKRDRLHAWMYRLEVRALFGVRLRDLGCIFALARRHIFNRIPLQSQGLFAHAEIAAKANFLGCLMNDVPVSYQPIAGVEDEVCPISVWPDLRKILFRPDFGPPDANFELQPTNKETADSAPTSPPSQTPGI
jgi:hypothetical protein